MAVRNLNHLTGHDPWRDRSVPTVRRPGAARTTFDPGCPQTAAKARKQQSQMRRLRVSIQGAHLISRRWNRSAWLSDPQALASGSGLRLWPQALGGLCEPLRVHQSLQDSRRGSDRVEHKEASIDAEP